MMTITHPPRIYPITENCIADKFGNQVFHDIISDVRSGKEVIIDFSQTKYVALPFFISFFDLLFQEEPLKETLKRVKKKGLTSIGEKIFKKTLRAYFPILDPSLPEHIIEKTK
jgi:hypothetical protein